MPRTPSRLRFIPSFEHMESRVVPAGNVNVYLQKDILYIVGDTLANRISVVPQGSGVSVQSLDRTTTINHQRGDQQGTVLIGGSFRAIRADLQGGDDILHISGFTLPSSLTVQMGEGNDILTVDSLFSARDSSSIATGNGNDIVNISNSAFALKSAINTGAGNDRVNLSGTTFAANSTVDGGIGSDLIGSVGNTPSPAVRYLGFETARSTLSPTAFNDDASLAFGESVLIDLTANDTAGQGTLDFSSLTITRQPTRGFVTNNGDGTVTYTNTKTGSTVDNFQYTIKNDAGAVSNVATVNLTIGTMNTQAPTARNDEATLEVGDSAIINVASNDSAATGFLDLGSIFITQQPARGTVVVNGDGTVTYTNNGNPATLDSFRYTIKDNEGRVSSQATVTIHLTPATNDDAPVAHNDVASVAQGGSVLISPLTNDTDLQNNINPTTLTIIQPPSRGTLTLNDDGTVNYQHDGSSFTTDSFTYTVTDFTGLVSNIATVNLTMTGPTRNNPVANDDRAIAEIGRTLIINVLANDSDPQNDINPATVTIVTQPTNGTVIVREDGTVAYTPNVAGSSSGDFFTYNVMDFTGLVSNTARVSITIMPAPTGT